MDSQYDPDFHELHSFPRPKIRNSPSCKLSAGSAAKSLSSFHGSCSTVNLQKPLIIHTFDPEIIVTEPVEFMWVVQRLTGSPETRRSLRASKRIRGEMQSMQAQDVEQEIHLMQESNESSLKEGTARACTAATAAGMTCDSSTIFCNKDHPSSPLSPNSSDICNICDNPLVLSSSSETFQFNSCKVSHLSPATSSNSANSKERVNYPSSPIIVPPTPCNNSKEPPEFLPSINPSTLRNNSPLINPSYTLTNNSPSPLSLNLDNLTTNNDPASPVSPNVSCNDSGNANHSTSLPIIKPIGLSNRDQAPWSPLSPTISGLTASSEADCHTDLSRESCASDPPARDRPLPPASNNFIEAAGDEDESSFFVFSFDSYYGNNAAQDDLELTHSTNVLVDSSYCSMALNPCTEAFNLSCLKDLATTWLPVMDEVV